LKGALPKKVALNHYDKLALLFMAGNENVFSEIYLKYYWPLYLHIHNRLRDDKDAEDVTQDTFMKALRALQKKQYTAEEHFKPWLYRIAENLVTDFLKSKKNRHKEKIEEELEETLPAPPAPPLSEHILAKHIEDALAELTEENRYIFTRHALDEKTFKEIGEEMKPKMDKEAVRKRYDRACEKLRPVLEWLKGKY
jgi:RNA polymerase sigma factor (sigma-70 family)